jgi:hypothetical protein
MQYGLHVRDLMHHDWRSVQLRGQCSGADLAIMVAAIRGDDLDAFPFDNPSVGTTAFDLILNTRWRGRPQLSGRLIIWPGAMVGSIRREAGIAPDCDEVAFGRGSAGMSGKIHRGPCKWP